MDKALWDQLQPLMDRALDLDPAERATWLSKLRQESGTIADELERHLNRQGTLDRRGFLEQSPLLDTSALEALAERRTWDLPTLQKALAGRYAVEGQIGEGGMATVYRATDARHRRPVAIKVVRPETASALGPRSFLHEIQLTANLAHPNILPLLDSGEADGVLYYVMPFVEGESLRARLKREGALPVADALAISRAVAEALAYAHGKGTVHRDIKPDNVLLSGRQAWVADFGIAKAMSHSASASHTVTGVGQAIGSPGYMAPEQIEGADSVDARADLYAWGAMMWEMLAGRPVFDGRSVQQLVLQHMTVDPPPLDKVRPGMPPVLAALVARCLSKDPTARPQSAAEVLSTLERASGNTGTRTRLLTTAAIATSVVAIAMWLALRPAAAPEPPVQLTTTGDAVGGALSPDGQWVAFRRTSTGPTLWLKRTSGDTTPPRRLAAGGPGMPIWIDSATIGMVGAPDRLTLVSVPDGKSEQPAWMAGHRLVGNTAGHLYAVAVRSLASGPFVLRRVTGSGLADSVLIPRDSAERLRSLWPMASTGELAGLSMSRDSSLMVWTQKPGGERRIITRVAVADTNLRDAMLLSGASLGGRYLTYLSGRDSAWRLDLRAPDARFERTALASAGNYVSHTRDGYVLMDERTRVGKTWRFSLTDRERPATVVDQVVTMSSVALSPDATVLAEGILDETAPRTELRLRRLDGGAIRSVVTLDGRVSRLQWSPDGNRIAFRSYRARYAQRWSVVDIRDGSVIHLGPPPTFINASFVDGGFPAAWSPDSRALYAQPFFEVPADWRVRRSELVDGDTGVVVHDFLTSTVRQRLGISADLDTVGINGVAASPDGTSLALGGDVLDILDLASGRTRRLIDVDTSVTWLLPIKWTTAGDIIFARRVQRGGASSGAFSLWAISARGGPVRSTGALPKPNCSTSILTSTREEASCFGVDFRRDLWLQRPH